MSRPSPRRSLQGGVRSNARPKSVRAGDTSRKAKVQGRVAERTPAHQMIERRTAPVPAAERRVTGEEILSAGTCNQERTQCTRRRVEATTAAATRTRRSRWKHPPRRCDGARLRPQRAHQSRKSAHLWSAGHMWRCQWKHQEIHLRHVASTKRLRHPRLRTVRIARNRRRRWWEHLLRVWAAAQIQTQVGPGSAGTTMRARIEIAPGGADGGSLVRDMTKKQVLHRDQLQGQRAQVATEEVPLREKMSAAVR